MKQYARLLRVPPPLQVEINSAQLRLVAVHASHKAKITQVSQVGWCAVGRLHFPRKHSLGLPGRH